MSDPGHWSEWTYQLLARNRFFPTPPPDLHFVGDGGYRAIGFEFLSYFVELGGLRPESSVLDIGCGVGRLAIPLTQYLAEEATYQGFDIVSAGIEWCGANISSRYENFAFHHLDVHHELYNPTGTTSSEEVAFPEPDQSVDFVFLVSVFTHLDTATTNNYLKEIRRVMKNGGMLFATFFLVDQNVITATEAQANRIDFNFENEGPVYFGDQDHPLAAVAYEKDWVLNALKETGFGEVVHHPGHWSGADTDARNYQDIVVCRT